MTLNSNQGEKALTMGGKFSFLTLNNNNKTIQFN